eukprot:CAMPEP_0172663930 /NCGR_PEP_ID=MMETSP1074-20121228/6261_1 /TAXON_ID=2916 /ORGANISM="Ceratium fusus, Strain PA161109" /LENGTH=65 /DNA_ID=CAMNT_0013480003 /DNA_START=63 /DNA_END=257 /DNA_ORIENTATION=+
MSAVKDENVVEGANNKAGGLDQPQEARQMASEEISVATRALAPGEIGVEAMALAPGEIGVEAVAL